MSAVVSQVLEGLDWRALAALLDKAADSLARLDEALRSAAFAAEGWRSRIDYHEACASVWLEGELAHLEDVVLREAGMDVRLASDATNRALAAFRTRRRSANLAPSRLLTRDELERIAGLRAGSPREDASWLFEAEEGPDPLQTFLSSLNSLASVPAPLAAAAGLETWRRLDPAPREPFAGLLAAAALLKRSGRTRHYVLPLALGMKEGRIRLASLSSVQKRIEASVEAMSLACAAGRRELDRLSIARERLAAKAKGRRADSRLADLGGLLLELPLVTAPLAARRLGISQQAVQKLMTELDGIAREVTGRGRYRAWAIL